MLNYEGAGLKNQLTTRAGLAFELNIWEIRKDGTYLREKCRPSIFEIPDRPEAAGEPRLWDHPAGLGVSCQEEFPTTPRVTRPFMPAYALGCTVINYDDPFEEMGGEVT